jgi:hypothetical protein
MREIKKGLKWCVGQTRTYRLQAVTFQPSPFTVKTRNLNCSGNSLRSPRNTLYQQRLALTSPTSGGRSVGIVSLRTMAAEISFFFFTSASTYVSMNATVCFLRSLRSIFSFETWPVFWAKLDCGAANLRPLNLSEMHFVSLHSANLSVGVWRPSSYAIVSIVLSRVQGMQSSLLAR